MQTIIYILPELFISSAIMLFLMLGVFIKNSYKLISFLTMFFGFYPEPLLNTLDVSINNLVNNYEADVNYYTSEINK